MNRLGKILERHARRTAPQILAYVTEVLSEPNTYMARRSDTNGSVRFAGPSDFALQVNQPVLLAKPDASGIMRNSAYLFVAVSPIHSRNATKVSVPHDQTISLSSEVVTNIPTSVELVAGGAAVQVLIYGKALSTAPTYGDTGITNHAAQSITSTLITLTVKASAAVADGEYSLTVAGVTYPKFFVVTS